MEGNAIPAKTLIPSNKGEKEEEGHPIQQCECIAQLFENISKLYNNNSNSTSSENCENCVSWSEFFDQFIVRDNELCTLPSGSSCVAHSDDMLWYVTLVRTSATAYDVRNPKKDGNGEGVGLHFS
jgi:hypothetical protein